MFTRNIQAAANLIAIGAKLREAMPVTAVRAVGKPDDVLFWFEPGNVTCANHTASATEWLRLFLCPWSEFGLSLDHPVAHLKAAAENRQILVAAVKSQKENPFRVIQNGNRVAVMAPAMTQANAKRLLRDG